MGNCGSSINCHQCYGGDGCLAEIEVDADIAGIGVLVAFFLAALVTCASIFYGYLTDSLPESLFSDMDKAVILRFQRSVIDKTLLPWIGRIWIKLKFLVYRCVGQALPDPRPPIPREQRVEAVTRFVLGFSDQQLVTGLAILIAALANRCQLTLHELRIVFCLAWFSATTHIATLKVLHEYFYDNKVVRNWRVIGIVVFLILLSFFQVILILGGYENDPSNVNHATPTQCIMDGRTRTKRLSALDVILGIYLLAIFLLPVYIRHTVALFRDPRKVGRSGDLISTSPLIFRSTLLPDEKNEIDENATIQQEVLTRNRSVFGPISAPGSITQYRHSFLSYLPTIMFSLTFGISQTVVITWYNSPNTTDDVRRMGFGQVVTLALLAIPALTASEIYNEARIVSANAPPVQSNPEQNLSSILDSLSSTRRSGMKRMLIGIRKDIQNNYSNQGLSQHRIVFVAVSLFHFCEKRSQSTNWPRNPIRERITSMMHRYAITNLKLAFIWHSFTQILGGITFNVTNVGQAAGLAVLLTWNVVALISIILEAHFRKQLIMNQLDLRDNWPTSEDDQRELWARLTSPSGIFNYRDRNDERVHLSLRSVKSEPYVSLVRQDTEPDIVVVRPRPQSLY